MQAANRRLCWWLALACLRSTFGVMMTLVQEQKEAYRKTGTTETRNSGNLQLPASAYQGDRPVCTA